MEIKLHSPVFFFKFLNDKVYLGCLLKMQLRNSDAVALEPKTLVYVVSVFKQYAGDGCHQDNQGNIDLMHGKQWFSPWLHIVFS